ncbi:MAG: DJ-1/PfpI family protein [Gammaproteobacteria bacterium]|nr:DJ-1/PfpI family protein [Gammaproteobacteria bacterium]MDH5629013.1 DJ-1/PfpI family protein [Gammaproteobacteria bacterium]
MNIGIYIYNNAEVLDFSGPFEVFSTASRLSKPADFFKVFLIAESKEQVKARGNYLVFPHYDIHNHPQLDVLIVVGGVHTEEMNKQSVLDWIKHQSKLIQLTASVCTGAFLLAKADVINNQTVTTHWEDIADLKNSFPDLNIEEKRRWIDEGDIVTSGGISAGIDMSLHLVSKLYSEELAEQTAKQMEYRWQNQKE